MHGIKEKKREANTTRMAEKEGEEKSRKIWKRANKHEKQRRREKQNKETAEKERKRAE